MKGPGCRAANILLSDNIVSQEEADMKTGEKSNRQAGTAGRVGRWFTVLVCIILFVSCGTAYANAPSDSQTEPVVIDPVSSSESVDSRTPTGGETKLTVSGSKYVAKGKTVTLIASADVTWKTGDKKIATVSAKGVVKGIKAGKVKITAVSKANPKLKKVWTMTVTAKAASKVTITAPATELSLSEKKTVTLKAAANPAQAAQSFEWQSSDSAVARVDQKGKVTAVSTGKATITATATDGSKKKAKVTITVKGSEDPKPKDQISVLVITLNPEESWYREKNVQDLRDTFTEANGYNATFVTAPWPGDQMDTFQSYIGQVDYILLCAADTNGWDELFARAKESGTGVFLYDRTVDCDPDLYLAAGVPYDLASVGEHHLRPSRRTALPFPLNAVHRPNWYA